MSRSPAIAILLTFIMSGTAYAANYAYVLKFCTNESDQLVRFNADKDEIVKKITTPDDSGWNNFLVDEKGGCFIASYRKDMYYGRDIYYYDPEKDRVERFINLGEIFGPSDMAMTKDDLMVHVKGYSGDMRQSDGVLFINRKSRKITKELYIPKGNYTQANLNTMYYDGSGYLVLPSFFMPPHMDNMDEWRQIEYTGDLFVIDTVQRKIIKAIPVPREYKYIDGACIIGDKIYATAATKGRMDSLGNCPVNDEILVFSLSEGRLKKTIRVDGFPLQLVHDKSKNIIYVLHRNENLPHSTIEAIDPATDKIVSTMTIPNQLMASLVAPHKIYVTAGNAQFEHRKIPSRLYSIDTRTYKIIKEFEGVYTGISINPEY